MLSLFSASFPEMGPKTERTRSFTRTNFCAMFLIELTYKVPFTELEPFMAEHLAFVEKGYASGHFVASGRKVPRDGGLIFSQASGKAELEELMQSDPFVSQNLVDLRIIEFVASRVEEGFKGFLS